MKKELIETIDDIYPLTIIKMRYGGKIIIFNMESDSAFIHDLQLAEEHSCNLLEYLEEKLAPANYGVAETIWEAFENYKKRLYNY